ncbi:hypothetical protein C1T31_11345 [Hanstruepera neustonica]|uniref:Secretion system C-terminal sorting domain-containing protein n=1 Tax=Hanstruepera neustonica TaxID=1445657 RepID=A0A2K1DWJ8_9FLAO|nr:hypothetical protein [Hanstruepera neustonica]PNQ72383.1 hypothetical protein C1T31_11345 [Hanstruepera neustonica]
MKLITNYYLALFVCFFNLIAFSNNASGINFNSNMTMQRVRIDFESPNGYVRPLLLGFTTDNSATDGVDYGYDGANFDQFPDDMFWLIENQNYVIQGVGAFDNSKQYPLALFLENSGTINITLNSLENFDTTIDVFLFDSILGTYTAISDSEFSIDMEAGEYLNRFYIAFSNPNNISTDTDDNAVLSIDDHELKAMSIDYYSASKEINISLSNTSSRISEVNLFHVNGQKIYGHIPNPNVRKIQIPMHQASSRYIIVEVLATYGTQRKLIAVY